jgi:hypothetical protein
MDHGRDGGSKGCLFWGCVTVIVLILLVIAGAGGLVFYGYRGQTAVRETAEAYLEATDAADDQRAYELLSPAWRERLDVDGFAAGEAQRRASLGECGAWRLAGMNVRSTSGQGSVADLAYRATCGAAEVEVSLHLVKPEDRWLVDGVEYGDATDLPITTAPSACPACATVNPPGANFCAHCGARLHELEETQP